MNGCFFFPKPITNLAKSHNFYLKIIFTATTFSEGHSVICSIFFDNFLEYLRLYLACHAFFFVCLRAHLARSGPSRNCKFLYAIQSTTVWLKFLKSFRKILRVLDRQNINKLSTTNTPYMFAFFASKLL